MARIAVDRARWVLAVSLLLLVVGAASIGSLTGGFSASLSLPGQPGYETNQDIVAGFGGGGASAPSVLAVRVPTGSTVTSPAVVDGLARGVQALEADLARPTAKGAGGPTPRVVAYGGAEDAALVSEDERTTYVLVFDQTPNGQPGPVDQGTAERFVDDAGLPEDTQVFATGLNALSSSTDGGGSSTLVETLLGAAGALIVLTFVFGSFLAVIPLLIAAVSIVTTFLLVGGISAFTEVSVIVQFLIALIGLGVAIDYSLVVVTRWREERASGVDNRAAVLESVRTAGHSVVFSGVTVAIGLLALVLLPVPFLRSVGYGAVLIPLVSIATSLTLLPALLATAGPFLDHPRRRSARSASEPSRAWTWWARQVIRFRWVAAVVGLGLLALLLVPAFSLRVGTPEVAALEGSGPATDGVSLLQSADVGRGALTPIEVLTTPDAADAVRAQALTVDGVRGVVETGRVDSSVVLAVVPDADTSGPVGAGTLEAVQDSLSGSGARIGGVGANTQSFNDAVYGSFPLMLTVIVLLTLVLLTRAFRSVVLAAKAVVLNILSVGATYGLLVLIWQQGHGSELIWGVPATGAITSFVPLMVFAFLFGLSMDYEVFILARMRESFDAHRSTDQAIVEGLGHTGKLVTSAALILFLSFLALSQTPLVDIKVFATGLGVGILLDATIVRALLVPALVSLFGRWNWWLPAPLARILRVEPSTTEQPPPEPGPPAPAGTRADLVHAGRQHHHE